MIAKIRDGDIIELDLENARLSVEVSEEEFASRKIIHPDLSKNGYNIGRELFINFRQNVSSAETGATTF